MRVCFVLFLWIYLLNFIVFWLIFMEKRVFKPFNYGFDYNNFFFFILELLLLLSIYLTHFISQLKFKFNFIFSQPFLYDTLSVPTKKKKKRQNLFDFIFDFIFDFLPFISCLPCQAINHISPESRPSLFICF